MKGKSWGRILGEGGWEGGGYFGGICWRVVGRGIRGRKGFKVEERGGVCRLKGIWRLLSGRAMY